MADRQVEYDVVVAGAGPSGLALAIELGTRGIKCLVLERNDRVGYAPRAKTTNVRTRTHLRRWSIADRLAERSPFGVDYPSNVIFVTRLGGFELARIENASNCAPARCDLYPEHGQWIPQYKLEEVLRDRAVELPSVTLRFSTELIGLHQSAERVELKVRTHCAEEKITCRYAVGADGSRSFVREAIGAKMEGQSGLSRNYNVVFRAPGLAAAHPHGPATMYWQVNPAAPSLIGPMDKDDIWFFMPTRLPDGVAVTPESAPGLIMKATGIDLPYEILSTDEWTASSLIADRYRQGNAFLIGDACHLHPPFGGYGMNMGVADGVDLGWKLAAVLQGWGGAVLLESYETERRTIHGEVIAEAAANHAVLSNDLWSDGIEGTGSDAALLREKVGASIISAKTREFHTLGTVLGGCYKQSPVLPSSDSCAAPEVAQNVYTPSSAPGCLAPHAWRADGTSLYDHFGSGFALLRRPDAPEAASKFATRVAAELGMPLAVVSLTEREAADRYENPLTLVRPDQYVAWAGNDCDAAVLRHAAGLVE